VGKIQDSFQTKSRVCGRRCSAFIQSKNQPIFGRFSMKRNVLLSLFSVLLCSTAVFANTAPTVTNVTSSQRNDGSGVVDISFRLTDADNDRCTVSVLVSNDGGSTFTIVPSSGALSGALTNVYPGNRTITWNSKLDLPVVFGSNYRVKVMANDGVFPTGPSDMV
jgi:hypothetical protein